jgi:general stress protein YciG
MTDNNNRRDGRGFAGMDPEKQREIASKGGKAAHEKGTAHEFDSEEAQEAGRKGGKASHSSDSSSSESEDSED